MCSLPSKIPRLWAREFSNNSMPGFLIAMLFFLCRTGLSGANIAFISSGSMAPLRWQTSCPKRVSSPGLEYLGCTRWMTRPKGAAKRGFADSPDLAAAFAAALDLARGAPLAGGGGTPLPLPLALPLAAGAGGGGGASPFPEPLLEPTPLLLPMLLPPGLPGTLPMGTSLYCCPWPGGVRPNNLRASGGRAMMPRPSWTSNSLSITLPPVAFTVVSTAADMQAIAVSDGSHGGRNERSGGGSSRSGPSIRP
mmetsp:Transcript_1007/g.2526  ORF Transcript_1007/g.2526 Transcript_1007/m.2526 type:complete len:251 (+) Transcript_1007:1471-2223(+)